MDFEGKFKAILTAIEAGQCHHDLGIKRNRELRRLTCSINYEVKEGVQVVVGLNGEL